MHLATLGIFSGLERAGDGHAGAFPDASQRLFCQEDFERLLPLAAQHPASGLATDGDPAFEHTCECDVSRDRDRLWRWRRRRWQGCQCQAAGRAQCEQEE